MQITKRFKKSDSDGELTTRLIRASFMPMLSVDSGVPIMFSPFVNPLMHESNEPGRSFRLGSRMRRTSVDISTRMIVPNSQSGPSDSDMDDTPGPEIVLWNADHERDPETWVPVLVDRMLARVLRPHQVEGVKFIYKCLMGLAGPGEGCILADDMGLGKTLQSITVIWTLLHSNIRGISSPAVRRVLVLCPASLVRNWGSEFEKWTKNKCKVIAVAESSRDKVIGQFTNFRFSQEAQVLITSYEAFRIHHKLVRESPIDLVVCDEAHRLKNDRTKLSLCISRLTARKRLLVTGTPIQNDLSEFFAMLTLALPELSEANFNQKYALAITRGRDPEASDKQKETADKALTELSDLSSSFILRRTNLLLSKLLPTKHLLILFCKLSENQRKAYTSVTDKLSSDKRLALTALMELVKVCCPSEPEGKMSVLKTLLVNFNACGDKSVVISSYTSCLDKVASLCKTLNIQFHRLDGNIGVRKRHQIVTEFNLSGCQKKTVFLLSSKAGGCGINLIGANRLVMLDADWNPANDKQAMARIWREGQKKECWIYRLFSTGTIEEKILQRQINKDGLSSSIVSSGNDTCALKEGLSSAQIRSLFDLKPPHVLSDTHQVIQCKKCPHQTSSKYIEDDLLSWDHLEAANMRRLPDIEENGCVQGSDKDISLAMYMKVDNP